MDKIDTERMRVIVNSFANNARPSGSGSKEPCTVEDARQIVKQTAWMMNALIAEIEKAQDK